MEPPTTKWPEALDDLAGVAVEEHEPGDADIQGQAEQGGDEQQRRKMEKSSARRTCMLTSRMTVAPGQVADQQQVEQHGRQRHDHHHHDGDDGGGDADLAQPGNFSHATRSEGSPSVGSLVTAVLAAAASSIGGPPPDLRSTAPARRAGLPRHLASAPCRPRG